MDCDRNSRIFGNGEVEKETEGRPFRRPPEQFRLFAEDIIPFFFARAREADYALRSDERAVALSPRVVDEGRSDPTRAEPSCRHAGADHGRRGEFPGTRRFRGSEKERS